MDHALHNTGEVSPAPAARVAALQALLARIAREYDVVTDGPFKGQGCYGHFTTRQNLQYNWIPLEKSAEVMELLADVDMHGIQTSGNCIRNITSDAFAGIAPDELIDPRPYCEILRQWSTLHPEFAHLPVDERRAIHEILTATLPGLPADWGK